MRVSLLSIFMSGFCLIFLIGCTSSSSMSQVVSSLHNEDKISSLNNSKSINKKKTSSTSKDLALPPKPPTSSSSTTGSLFTGDEPYLKYLNFDELKEAFITAGFSLTDTHGEWTGYSFLAQNDYGSIEVVELIRKSPEIAQLKSEESISELKDQEYILMWESSQEKLDEEHQVLVQQITSLFNPQLNEYEYICVDGYRLYYFINISPENLSSLNLVLKILGFSW